MRGNKSHNLTLTLSTILDFGMCYTIQKQIYENSIKFLMKYTMFLLNILPEIEEILIRVVESKRTPICALSL